MQFRRSEFGLLSRMVTDSASEVSDRHRPCETAGADRHAAVHSTSQRHPQPLSSKALEDDLNEIRKNFTPSLGKDHGRVVMKSAKPKLLERLTELRTKLEAHQKKVETELQTKLDESKKQVVDYYLPLARANPPDALVGSLLKVTDDDIKRWLESELSAVFPNAEHLIHEMVLDARYKDVTFETLNQADFLKSVKAAFPRIDWDKPFHDFKAAGEASEGPP